DIVKPYGDVVASVVATVGEGTADPQDMSAMGQSDTPNKARITINFADFKFRNGQSTTEIMEKVRDGMAGYPGVAVTVAKNADGPPTGKPITIELTGEDIYVLADLAERMKNFINQSGIA